jgi:hypothetical protein
LGLGDLARPEQRAAQRSLIRLSGGDLIRPNGHIAHRLQAIDRGSLAARLQIPLRDLSVGAYRLVSEQRHSL